MHTCLGFIQSNLWSPWHGRLWPPFIERGQYCIESSVWMADLKLWILTSFYKKYYNRLMLSEAARQAMSISAALPSSAFSAPRYQLIFTVTPSSQQRNISAFFCPPLSLSISLLDPPSPSLLHLSYHWSKFPNSLTPVSFLSVFDGRILNFWFVTMCCCMRVPWRMWDLEFPRQEIKPTPLHWKTTALPGVLIASFLTLYGLHDFPVGSEFWPF